MLCTKRLKAPPLLINTQHYSSRLQYGGRCRLSRLSSILRPTHSQQTLTFRWTGKVEIRRLHMQITQSQDSENAQRNLEMAQILRLHGTYLHVNRKYTLITIPYTLVVKCNLLLKLLHCCPLRCRSLGGELSSWHR